MLATVVATTVTADPPHYPVVCDDPRADVSLGLTIFLFDLSMRPAHLRWDIPYVTGSYELSRAHGGERTVLELEDVGELLIVRNCSAGATKFAVLNGAPRPSPLPRMPMACTHACALHPPTDAPAAAMPFGPFPFHPSHRGRARAVCVRRGTCPLLRPLTTTTTTSSTVAATELRRSVRCHGHRVRVSFGGRCTWWRRHVSQGDSEPALRLRLPAAARLSRVHCACARGALLSVRVRGAPSRYRCLCESECHGGGPRWWWYRWWWCCWW